MLFRSQHIIAKIALLLFLKGFLIINEKNDINLIIIKLYINFMDFKNELLENVDKIHTTKLGIERVKKNLGITCNNVVEYCIDLIEDNNSLITQKGKNYYVEIDNKIITVNKSSFTIITAHKIKKK